MSKPYRSGQPATDFEQAHGVSGIAGRYTFPDVSGMDRLSLQKKIWPESGGYKLPPHEEFMHIFHELEKLNPEQVAKIQFNRNEPKQLMDAVLGMISGFNTDDINLFMKRLTGHISAEEIQREEFQAKITQRLKNNTGFGWVASDETLEKIWQQVKERPVVTLLDEAKAIVKNNSSVLAIELGIVAIGSYALWQVFVKRNKKDAIKPKTDGSVNEEENPGYTAAYLKEKQNPDPHVKS